MKNENRTCDNKIIFALNLIPDLAVIVNKTGEIVAVNQAVQEATGGNAEGLVGKHLSEAGFLDDENKAILTERLKKQNSELRIGQCEVKVISKTGEDRYFEVMQKKTEYREETVDIVLFHDVTGKRTLQKQLEQKIKDVTSDLMRKKETIRSIFESSPNAI
jgi:PAS domain S-box-containing protein